MTRLLPLLLLLTGCASHPAAPAPNEKAAQQLRKTLVQQLPVTRLQGAAQLPGVAVLSATRRGRTVELAWENQPTALSNFCSTHIEATSDFRNWAQVARLPFQLEGRATLTNRPEDEFYRAFNGLSK